MKKFIACLFFIILFFALIPNINTCANNDINKDDPIYILAIGNSHTALGYKYLYKILHEAGYKKVVIGCVFIKGSTMQSRYNHFINNDESFTYLKYNNRSKYKRYKNITLSEVLKDEKWNYIIIQQNSYRKCKIDSYISDKFNISNYIDKIKKYNKKAKIGLFIPWNKSILLNNKYFNSIEEQYECIQSTSKLLQEYDDRISFIINIGKNIKSIQNSKFLSNLQILRNDYTHLAYGAPIFISSYSIASYFGVSRDDISWYPDKTFDKRITIEYDKKIFNKIKKIIDKNNKEVQYYGYII